MKDVKEKFHWTDRDSNRECLKFDEVDKNSCSTKLLILSMHQIRKMRCQQFTLKFITLAYQILIRAKPVSIIGINLAAFFQVC